MVSRAKEYQQAQNLVTNHCAFPNLSWTAGPKTDGGRGQAFLRHQHKTGGRNRRERESAEGQRPC